MAEDDWNDDIFPPQIVQVAIPSLDAGFAGNTVSPQSVVTFTGHDGKYELTYDWQVHGDTQANGLGILAFRQSLTSLQVFPGRDTV